MSEPISVPLSRRPIGAEHAGQYLYVEKPRDMKRPWDLGVWLALTPEAQEARREALERSVGLVPVLAQRVLNALGISDICAHCDEPRDDCEPQPSGELVCGDCVINALERADEKRHT
jgi:hypothetical protein